ncbi:kinesin-like protein KIN-14I isoform X1 [Beta vulgaris subsp. vulgaris]|uniref:kinesin-like protein KIN-14I isoform X1 n=1 Tax=Beta vulgaris subsp. vulgaris TaxID=3555 RepID=UPI0025478484|nr:kinesin-like protein KIN-14I isoform X1 [Beta vulgaris subsp. vulgaris]
MAASDALSFSVASVVEDVLQQHGNRLKGLDLDSRRAEEAAMRRYEAASWLRKMVGVVAAKDLPAEPSEEDYRLGLRSGLILCNVLNKVQPGAVPKVVESPTDSALLPDGAALSAYQYFENVRNFLVAAEEMGLPTFDASDLEQGGISARVVNSVLALKSYHEWKQTGGTGVWKFSGNVKPTMSVKQFVRTKSEPFTNSLTRNSSMTEKSLNALSHDIDTNKMPSSHSLSALVQALLSDKNPEEVPQLVESVLSKVVEEFEQRIGSKNNMANLPRQATTKDFSVSHGKKSFSKMSSANSKVEHRTYSSTKKQENNHIHAEQLRIQKMKQLEIFDRQGRDIQELKHTVRTTKAGMQFIQTKFQEDLQNLGAHMYGLAQAASGYHKVLEENRRLYNEVQDLKGSIRVYCRVRPFLGGKSSYVSTIEHFEEGNISIRAPSKHGKGLKSFGFNKVFGPSATQAEVFSDMQPLIRSVLDGFNVCIFAYGQTGSGKTFTMSGPKDLTEQSQGVNYRSLGDLFYLAEQRKDTFRYDVAVQMIEIYNEQVRDLLVSDGLNKRLEIRNSSQNGLNVPEASLVSVSSTSDVIHLMNVGHRNRAVGSTALNDRSSRSHSCLTVHVQGKDLTTGAVLRGCMHLVDLAGSERVDKSEVTGDRLKEAQHINKSLSALGDVIASLAQKNSHVPYRNSKLTQLLQDSLGGQAKTLMFVHISPEAEAVGETLSTLKFAERVATVELGAARVNKDGADVKELKEQIASLKAALARKDADSVRSHQSGSSSPERYRGKVDGPSPLSSNQIGGNALFDLSRHQQVMGDIGNIEDCNKSASRQKRQSFDLDEVLKNSPPWPPVNSPGQNYVYDEKDLDSGDWVDKIMVNKHESLPKTGNRLCWDAADNGHTADSFYHKYFPDGSKLYSEQSYNMFSGSNQFEVTNADDLDEIDAATSDSSEPDLLWQFNHSKLPTLSNGIGLKSKKVDAKPAKSPDLSKPMIPTFSPSPSRKLPNGNQKIGRQQPVSVEAKRRAGNRK